MNNNRSEATTRGETTIDAIFSRYISNIKSHIFVSYFINHKPIIRYIKYDNYDVNNLTIEEL